MDPMQAAAEQPEPTPDWEALFARNLAPLVAFIRVRANRGILGRESATDLAQSVCREVMEDAGEFEYRGEEAFRAWLYQQATRKILDRNRYIHRARRDVRREIARENGPGDDEGSVLGCLSVFATPSRNASAREQLARFEEALQGLPDGQRDAVMMSRLMGIGYSEIAAELGVTESAVRGLVARGLAALTIALG